MLSAMRSGPRSRPLIMGLRQIRQRAPRLLPRGRSLARATRTRASGAPGPLAIILLADGLYPPLHCTHCIKFDAYISIANQTSICCVAATLKTPAAAPAKRPSAAIQLLMSHSYSLSLPCIISPAYPAIPLTLTPFHEHSSLEPG